MGDDPGTRIFENNVMSAYNALVAAGRAGAEIVWTPSQGVYGTLFADEPWLPDYLPIDEGHEAALSNAKAEGVLDWEPAHAWDDGEAAEASRPRGL